MELNYFGKSDKGRTRKLNEDYFAYARLSDDEDVFIIADGMGGHRSGKLASKLTSLTFINRYTCLRAENNSIIDSMSLSIQDAHKTIIKKAKENPRKRGGMGTTLSAMVLENMKANIVHVGDSRIYLIRNGEIKNSYGIESKKDFDKVKKPSNIVSVLSIIALLIIILLLWILYG